MRVLALSVLYLFYWPPFFFGSSLYRKYYRTSQYLCGRQSCQSMEEELLGCHVTTFPHEKIYTDSNRQQLMAQLFVGSIDKPSLCFTMMAAKSIFFTSLYSLVLYTALSICTKQGQSSPIKESTRHVQFEFPRTVTVSYSTRHRNSANDSK